jgi:tRNA 2-thiouridine synthesizing protein A
MDRHSDDGVVHLDVTSLRCPLPLLKAKKALTALNAGEMLKVSATDPGSQRDFQAYMEHSNHTMLDTWQEADVYWYLIERGEQ